MAYTLRQKPANAANYTLGRQGKKIDKIVIHHAATTWFEGIAMTFQNPLRGASAHYGVGRNNNVDQYVSEKNTSWANANWNANTTSVTIENVNSTGGPSWKIAPETFDTLVELVRDVAKRNNLGKLVVGKNLFGHKDFNPTACPGVLYGRLQELADKVNKGSTVPAPKPAKPDQILEVGSRIVFNKTYRVDEIKNIHGLWQVRTKVLCPVGFTWIENGIPVAPLTEVSGGKPTSDQVLKLGSTYKIPGKYTVHNLGSYKGRWLAQVSLGGYKVWVDVETLTEI